MRPFSKTPSGLLCLVLCSSIFASGPSPQNTMSSKQIADKFGAAMAQVEKYYVMPIQNNKLLSNAINGMLAGLDPHSTYLDEEALRELSLQTSGEFSGLGLEITTDQGLVKVIAPLDGTPAQKAGLQAGDYILAVNDVPIVNMPLNEATKLIRGKKGTTVTLSVYNKKDKNPRKISFLRSVIHIENIKSRLLDGGFGYIRITHFQDNTGKQVTQTLKDLQRKNHVPLPGLILDLRNNPGGLLDSAIEVADIFLDSKKIGPKEKIVYTQGRTEEENVTAYATKNDFLSGAPLVILINEGSASASEVVAGALQDHKRAVIIGQRSFGKGSVQTILPIDNTSAIKLTTALYYTPKGRSIQAEGIQPDILVDQLEIPKEKDDASFLLKIHEAALNNHLKNNLPNNQKSQLIVNNGKLSQLARDDYQLYEALQILKSLHVFQHSPYA